MLRLFSPGQNLITALKLPYVSISRCFLDSDVPRNKRKAKVNVTARKSQVASPRRPRSAVGGLGTPVRSEIGPYQALA